MEFSSRSYADVVVAAPVGRIDYENAAGLQSALEWLLDAPAAAYSGLLLDFSHVDFISSVGLRVVMLATKRMRAGRRGFAVAALTPVVAEIFAISRFDRVVDVLPSVRAALEKLSPAALTAFDSETAPRTP